MTPDYLMADSSALKRGSSDSDSSSEEDLLHYKRSRSDPGDFDDEFSEAAIFAALDLDTDESSGLAVQLESWDLRLDATYESTSLDTPCTAAATSPLMTSIAAAPQLSSTASEEWAAEPVVPPALTLPATFQLPPLLVGGEAPRGERSGERTHGDWSAEEDAVICETIGLVGCKWRAVAAMLPGRSDDAVRNRWARLLHEGRSVAPPADGFNKVKKNLTANNKTKQPRPAGVAARQCWTCEEDSLILESVHQMGTKWGRISKLMPNRTEHGVRNRYNRLMLLAIEKAGPSPTAASGSSSASSSSF